MILFLSLCDLNCKIVALEENIGTIIDLQKNYPNIIIKTFQNTTLSLDAVSRGLADAYIGNRAVVSYKIKEELLDNLKIDTSTFMTDIKGSPVIKFNEIYEFAKSYSNDYFDIQVEKQIEFLVI